MEIDNWGFLEYSIIESISVTESGNGFNIAPMGVYSDPGDQKGYARLWSGSDTLDNIRNRNQVDVYLTRNPVIYARGAIGDPQDIVNEEGVIQDYSALFECSAYMERLEKDGELEIWRLEIDDAEIREKHLPVVNRGFNAIIEACVHATRLEFRPELEELIEHHLEIARKCGGKKENKSADLLENYIKDLE